MNPVISIIICTYNRASILDKSLPALLKQSFSPYEVILVDDGSSDNTKDIASKFSSCTNFVYIYKENGGLASARNAGLSSARGEYVLLTDDDIFADYYLLEEHLKTHKTGEGLVVKGIVNHFSGEKVPEKPEFTMEDISYNFFWTSNVSIKKEYIDRAGRFDEDFREYGWEDIELGLRLRKLGLKSVTNKKAIVYHFKKELTFRDIPSVLKRAGAKGRSAVVFLKKNSSWRARLTTGVFFPRFQINMFLFSNKIAKKIFNNILASQKEDLPLTFFQKLCLRQLALIVYYEAIRKEFYSKFHNVP